MMKKNCCTVNNRLSFDNVTYNKVLKIINNLRNTRCKNIFEVNFDIIKFGKNIITKTIVDYLYQ